MATLVFLPCLISPIIGALFGLPLWLVLRREYPRAVWLILAAAGCWTLATIANGMLSVNLYGLPSLMFGSSSRFGSSAEAFLAGVIYGAIFALLTAPTVVWVLSKKASPSPPG
jgi:hypothetical protein